MQFDQLMLALQTATKVMGARENIKVILDLVVDGKREEADEAMRKFLSEFFIDGINTGLELAVEKLEDRFYGV